MLNNNEEKRFKRTRKMFRNEKGAVSIFLMLTMVFLMILGGLLINVMMTVATISHAKTSLREAVEFRAEAVDIPLKEAVGVVEVMNYPHTGTNTGYTRPTEDALGRAIPSANSTEYINVVNESILYSKVRFIDSMKNFVGKNIFGTDFLPIEMNQICFDVRPLPETRGEVTFSCPIKDYNGNIKTVELTIEAEGYKTLVNKFEDEYVGEDIVVSNVVFGAAIIKPNSAVIKGIAALGISELSEQIIYSVAYPQIDACYGGFCE